MVKKFLVILITCLSLTMTPSITVLAEEDGYVVWFKEYQVRYENAKADNKVAKQKPMQVSNEIKVKVREVTEGLNTDYEKANAICNWIAANIQYDYDGYEGRSEMKPTDAESVFRNRVSVCDGYANLTVAMLSNAGIEVCYVRGLADGAGGWELHGWNYVYADNRWFPVDNTWDSCRGKNIYFDMSIEEFALTHMDIEVVLNPWEKVDEAEAKRKAELNSAAKNIKKKNNVSGGGSASGFDTHLIDFINNP